MKKHGKARSQASRVATATRPMSSQLACGLGLSKPHQFCSSCNALRPSEDELDGGPHRRPAGKPPTGKLWDSWSNEYVLRAARASNDTRRVVQSTLLYNADSGRLSAARSARLSEPSKMRGVCLPQFTHCLLSCFKLLLAVLIDDRTHTHDVYT